MSSPFVNSQHELVRSTSSSYRVGGIIAINPTGMEARMIATCKGRPFMIVCSPNKYPIKPMVTGSIKNFMATIPKACHA